MNKKIIISENEKKHIKKLYNINEIDSDKAIEFLRKFIGKDSEDLDDFDEMDSQSKIDDDDDDEFITSTNNLGNFENVTNIIIDKFEGGYWNPFCPHPKQNMGVSTETMFGLDRYNGNIESKPDGKKFFEIIDKEKYDNGAQSNGSGKNMTWTNMGQFCQKWKWLYRGGDKEKILKDLAVKIMKGYFDSNMSNFVKSPELKEKIENIPPLTLHMSYAAWNGPGFFKKFAQSLEDGINQGMSNKELINKAMEDRRKTQPLLHQENVIKAMKEVMT